MQEHALTVIITTYNRPALVQRAVASVRCAMHQDWRISMVVVDDCSTDRHQVCPAIDLSLISTPANVGPGGARMVGLKAAASDLVLILDDDDQLERHAIATIEAALCQVRMSEYPAFMFRTAGAIAQLPYRINRLHDYLGGQIAGDFSVVINRPLFLATGLAYPPFRIGGEHLLWWQIARDVGIPTWENSIIAVGSDASTRLTNYQTQVARAEEHWELAKCTLASFGQELRQFSRDRLRRVERGRVAYALLSGHRDDAIDYLPRSALPRRERAMFSALARLPRSVIRLAFAAYRKRSVRGRVTS